MLLTRPSLAPEKGDQLLAYSWVVGTDPIEIPGASAFAQLGMRDVRERPLSMTERHRFILTAVNDQRWQPHLLQQLLTDGVLQVGQGSGSRRAALIPREHALYFVCYFPKHTATSWLDGSISRTKMHQIQRVFRIDYYLELVFEDDSARAIDLASHLKPDVPLGIANELGLAKITILPYARSITWDDGTEISADFLYDNSLLIGWVDRTWGNNTNSWQPLRFNKAEIKVETSGTEAHSGLLLDGKPFPALMISSATFGIHENTPWYHVPFPGDDGVYEPQWEEPQIVFDTLEQLVLMAKHAIESKTDVSMDITGLLQKTGCDLRARSISPRIAAVFARQFRKHVT